MVIGGCAGLEGPGTSTLDEAKQCFALQGCCKHPLSRGYSSLFLLTPAPPLLPGLSQELV